MARIVVTDHELRVELTLLEQFFALRRGWSVPLSQVRSMRWTERPRDLMRGVRIGTGLPGVVTLGILRHAGGDDFVAVYGEGPGVVIDLAPGARYVRAVISMADRDMVNRFAAS